MIHADSQKTIKEMLIGKWSVTATHFFPDQVEKIVENNLKFQAFLIDNNYNKMTASLFMPDSDDPIFDSVLVFNEDSNGSFIMKKNKQKFAEFNFEVIKTNQTSSFGDWGPNKTYNAIFVNHRIAQLTLFDKHSQNWSVYTLNKDDDERSESSGGMFSLIFMVLTIIGGNVLSRFIHQWRLRKNEQNNLNDSEGKKKQKKQNRKNKGKKH